METALETVRELSPEYAEAAEEYFNGTLFYPCNLFVMRREVFDQYCRWLYPLLFELEKRIDICHYDEKEQRVFGLLGERLLGVFYLQYKKTHPEGKYRIVQRSLFWNTERSGECRETLTRKLKRILKSRLGENSALFRLLKRVYHFFKK